MSKSREISWWLFFGLALRCAYVALLNGPANFIFSDMANYLHLADKIQNNQWNDNLFFQPIGYPMVLVIIKTFFQSWSLPLAFGQALFSTLSLFFMWKVAEETWGSRVAKISLILGVVHLPFILNAGFALAETFFGFQLALLLYLSLKIVKTSAQKMSYSILWGIFFLLGFWLKGSHVFMVPLFILGIFYFYRSKGFFKTILPLSLVVATGMIAHGLLTYNKIGKFQMSASAGGLNFVEGKCPSKKNYDSRGTLWISPLYYQLMSTPAKRWDEPFTNSSYFMKAGLNCIKDNPLVLLQSIEGIPYLFYGNTLWPANQIKGAAYVRLYELLFTLFVVPGFILFFYLKQKRWKVDEMLVWGVPVLSIFLCVYIFKSEVRFRIPFDIFLIPMAVKGWSLLSFKAHCLEPVRAGID